MSNIDTVRTGFKEIADRGIDAMLDMPHTDDVKMHIPTLGIVAQGEVDIRDNIISMLKQIEMRQELHDLIADGPFVTCTLRVESTLRNEPTTAVQVVRFEGDKVAEVWAITPPLPA
jgi:hypothetical protein